MKVIKVVTRAGLCCQDYGAKINDLFARGSKEKCLDAIRKDIVWNANCYEDSGSQLIFVNGNDIEDGFDSQESLEEYVR